MTCKKSPSKLQMWVSFISSLFSKYLILALNMNFNNNIYNIF